MLRDRVFIRPRSNAHNNICLILIFCLIRCDHSDFQTIFLLFGYEFVNLFHNVLCLAIY